MHCGEISFKYTQSMTRVYIIMINMPYENSIYNTTGFSDELLTPMGRCRHGLCMVGKVVITDDSSVVTTVCWLVGALVGSVVTMALSSDPNIGDASPLLPNPNDQGASVGWFVVSRLVGCAVCTFVGSAVGTRVGDRLGTSVGCAV